MGFRHVETGPNEAHAAALWLLGPPGETIVPPAVIVRGAHHLTSRTVRLAVTTERTRGAGAAVRLAIGRQAARKDDAVPIPLKIGLLPLLPFEEDCGEPLVATRADQFDVGDAAAVG